VKTASNVSTVHLSLVFALLALAADGAAAQDWTAFSSAEGRFSILMPGNPTKGTVAVRAGDAVVTAHVFTALSRSIDLMVGYGDFPSPQHDPEKIFDATRDGSLGGVHGTLLSEEKVKLNGYPGRRFRATGVGNAFVDEEMYLVDRRLYLITIATATKSPDRNIDKILASFRLKLDGH